MTTTDEKFRPYTDEEYRKHLMQSQGKRIRMLEEELAHEMNRVRDLDRRPLFDTGLAPAQLDHPEKCRCVQMWPGRPCGYCHPTGSRERVRNAQPQSNAAWFAWAVPTEEALEVAEAWENDKDSALREMARAAREHYENYGVGDDD
jgi:hypothetical protein